MSGPTEVLPEHRILLVDDEVNFLWSVARALRVKGYQVMTAESGEVALTVLGKHQFDLVITDIKMPGMDGFELVEWLRVHRPEIAVVMTTSFGSLTMRERSLHLGALTYIEKPIDLPTLTDFLDRLFYAPNFAGRISDIDLLDYLQLLANTYKSKIIQVTNRRETGRLIFEAGQIVHAECGELTGLPAFYRVVSWPGGAFTELPFELSRARTVDENTSYLLMEAARARDERALGEPLLGSFPRPSTKGASPSSTQEEAKHPDMPLLSNEAGRSGTSRNPGLTSGDRAGSSSDEMASTTPMRQDESRPGTGPFNRYRRFLDGVCAAGGVRGAVLLTREGLILARGGEARSGIEGILTAFSTAFDQIGAALELDRYDSGVLLFPDGEQLRLEPLGLNILGVWLRAGPVGDDLASWIYANAGSLD